MNPFFHSVKFRLTLWYVFILAIILIAFSVLMHTELKRVLYNDADQVLMNQSQAIEYSLRAFLGRSHIRISEDDGRPNTFSEGKFLLLLQSWENEQRHLGRSTIMIRLINHSDRVYMSNLKGWEQDIIFPNFERDSVFMENGASYQTIHFQNKPVRLYYQDLTVRGFPPVIIQTGYSLYDVEVTLRRLVVILLIWIPVALIVSLIAGWFMSRRALSPIDLMIQQARKITAAYLNERLPRSETGDELDRLAETLNEMMDRLESSTRAVREFSTDVSHELKTPLAIIKGEVDLALRKKRSVEDYQVTFRIIEEEVTGLTRLVNDLMLLVRSDSNQLKFEMQRVSLKEVLEYVFSRFRDRAVENKIDFSFFCEQDTEILGDEVYLKRLFANLVDNAIKFTPQGGMIRIYLGKERGRAFAEISDTGMGIEKEIQEKVFSRFFRSDSARPHEGSGLGLNIAKVIVDAHNGKLQLSSQLGQGTTVSVHFPAI